LLRIFASNLWLCDSLPGKSHLAQMLAGHPKPAPSLSRPSQFHAVNIVMASACSVPRRRLGCQARGQPGAWARPVIQQTMTASVRRQSAVYAEIQHLLWRLSRIWQTFRS